MRAEVMTNTQRAMAAVTAETAHCASGHAKRQQER